MKRFWLLFFQEFRFLRIALPLHLVVVVQPALMYWLLSTILVQPTFDMNLAEPQTPEGKSLAAAMLKVGSPIGEPYIHPVLIDPAKWDGSDQLVQVEEWQGVPTAVQYFGYIDSNLVKNYRNRLTAAALRLWNDALGNQAVRLNEQPWLPQEMPYGVYFGMALLPMAGFLAAAALGAAAMSQEFEGGTVMQYRLSPVSAILPLGVRLLRLVLVGWLSSGVLLVCVGLCSGVWPSSLFGAALVLLPVVLFAGCLGLSAGMLTRRFLPSFVVALIGALLSWMLGSSFGLGGSFGDWYELLGRLSPNTYAVELLFPLYYGGVRLGETWLPVLALAGFSLLALTVVVLLYRHRVRSGEPPGRRA